MKKLITLSFLLSICLQVISQKSVFIRLYDNNGKKISKGQVIAVSDTSVQLRNGNNVPVQNISIIKCYHSGWNNVLFGTSVGLIGGAILGSTNPPTNSSGGNFTWAGSSTREEFAIGLQIGAFSGAVIGGITNLFKRKQTFIIYTDKYSWNIFKGYISEFNPKQIN